MDVATGSLVTISEKNGGGSLRCIRATAAREGWNEVAAGDDPPSWSLGDDWRLSYEPGGQLEVSSAPCSSATRLVERMFDIVESLRDECGALGIHLLSAGVDPCNDISSVPLQLHRARYQRMARYFDHLGASGARMMRQTASLQINLEMGTQPAERWILLNGLAPYLMAMFANSPLYRGAATGHRSYRAFLWRTLDKSRTGLPVDADDPVGAYLDFALDAGSMMRENDGVGGSFRQWVADGSATLDDWRLHLTTLFPEVRPRSWFEVRSVDAIDPEWMVAPISFVCGLIYSDAVAARTKALVAEPTDDLLVEAGKNALRNPELARTAAALAELALEGLDNLGTDFLSETHLQRVEQFFETYTFRNRSPADDRD